MHPRGKSLVRHRVWNAHVALGSAPDENDRMPASCPFPLAFLASGLLCFGVGWPGIAGSRCVDLDG